MANSFACCPCGQLFEYLITCDPIYLLSGKYGPRLTLLLSLVEDGHCLGMHSMFQLGEGLSHIFSILLLELLSRSSSNVVISGSHYSPLQVRQVKDRGYAVPRVRDRDAFYLAK